VKQPFADFVPNSLPKLAILNWKAAPIASRKAAPDSLPNVMAAVSHPNVFNPYCMRRVSATAPAAAVPPPMPYWLTTSR
jgi:hypothetical protein